MTGAEWMLLLYVGLGAMAMMFALWLLHFPLKDAGLVDVGWSIGLGSSAIVYAVFADGDVATRTVIGILGGVWGWRLGLHLLFDRVLAPGEDGRYEDLRERWGDKFGARMLPFFEFQAGLIVVLSLPFLLAAVDRSPGLGVFDYIGIALWLVGVVGETIADQQLKAFKRRPDSKGEVCTLGLWRYSRHPNYFFEWLIWLGFAAVALNTLPIGLLGLIGPALILFFVLKVTGIPPTEARAIKSRGDKYRQYQRETSAFFPLPPKKATD